MHVPRRSAVLLARGLQKRFQETLKLDDAHAHFPALAPYAIAAGAAEYAGGTQKTYTCRFAARGARKGGRRSGRCQLPAAAVRGRAAVRGIQAPSRHARCHDARIVTMYEGDAYLGIDCGSYHDQAGADRREQGRFCYTYYNSNTRQPRRSLVREAARSSRPRVPAATASRLAVLRRHRLRRGAHPAMRSACRSRGWSRRWRIITAARHFRPDVDFIIDIGGQDIKCFKIHNGAIDNHLAQRGMLVRLRLLHRRPSPARWATRIEEFRHARVCSPTHPVDLGSRCTVFMNSSVKQAQKDGATHRRHFRRSVRSAWSRTRSTRSSAAQSPNDLGEHIVVQGGTFLNDAVLRAFEQEIGARCHPPDDRRA